MASKNPSTSNTNNNPNEASASDNISEEFLIESDDCNEDNKHSLIQDIQEKIGNVSLDSKNQGTIKKSDSFTSKNSENFDKYESTALETTSSTNMESTKDDYLHDKEWLMQKKHIFILSSAGKPIYSLHGNEDKLASFFGVLLALVSFVQSTEDSIISIHSEGVKFVFLVRNALILVAVSRTNLSVHQLQMQLKDVYNQILSTLTYSHMTNIFEKRKNFDLRRLLAGSERLIDHLLVSDSDNKISNNVFIFLTNSVRIMPLNTTMRNNITSAIQANCSKIKNLVFALLIAKNRLIAFVRMKKYSIHPADLRLILNLIECSESFKTAESWTPICLPKFDQNGFLHAHVSYLSDDCQACLLLLSVERDVFFTLSDAKKKITEKLRRSHCLEAINEVMNDTKGINLEEIGVPEIRHFIYKLKSNSQLICSNIVEPYTTPTLFEQLKSLYYNMYDRIHNSTRPLKLIYEVHETEIILAWSASTYELYAVFEPFVDKNDVIKLLDKLLRWIDSEEDKLFIKNHPTF